MEHYKTRQPPPGLRERLARARELTPTQVPSPPSPRSSYEYEAHSGLNSIAPLPPLPFGAYDLPRLPIAITSPFVPNTASYPTGGGVYVAADGSIVRSDAGFRTWSVPGNYRNRNDYNMVHRGPIGSVNAEAQQYPALAATQDQYIPTPQYAAPVVFEPAPTGASSPIAAAASPTIPVHQVQEAVPLLGVRTCDHRAICIY